MLGLLVHACRRVSIACPEGREELRDVDDRRPAVGDGIAKVEADRVPAVALPGAEEPLRHQVESLVPAHLYPLVTHALDGAPQPIRIVGEVLQSDALGAEITLAEGVGCVTANPGHAIGLDRDLEAAGCLAQIACAVVDGHVTPRGGCPRA
jgi:hypothetical protein